MTELSRRHFLLAASCASAHLASAFATRTPMGLAPSGFLSLTPYATGLKIAATPAVQYRAYRSCAVPQAETSTWIQIDLKRSLPIDAIQLFPASERMFPGRDQYYAGEGFPVRFLIEASEDDSFQSPVTIADFRTVDFPDPVDNVTQFSSPGARGRFVRLTATRLRPVKTRPPQGASSTTQNIDSPDFTLTLAKVAVLSHGSDLAVGCPVLTDPAHGNPQLASQLTRPYRQDGEFIHRDNPYAVTDPATWRPARHKAVCPKSGVALHGGLFQTAMENNIEYLLSTYTTEDLLRQFYERTGKIKNFKPSGSQVFWEEDLAGSNAGRFLMGAGNTLRWMPHPELQHRLDAVVDGIAACRQPNGYIMAYPEDTIFYSERAAYTRAWLTHGLLEAAYCGNTQALPLLRGYYDWFNHQAFLPEMLRGAIQGGQGMVANTRIATSPVGIPKDAQVIQQFYQEDAWLNGLARREKEQIWQYPYDRPHCYLLTNLEAYLDLYQLTGNPLYYDAVLGAWELYRAHWQQAGGSISIIEFETNPPDSNDLKQKLGELCGSSFWVFLSQRFQLLNPDDERFATEIEKSIYNVGLANQDGKTGLRYHTILEGKKENGTHFNTCCEGQGTRLLGSLPEHIYSVAHDGIYIHLFEPSTIRWVQSDQAFTLTVETRFPFATRVKATLRTEKPTESNLRIRIPSWASVPMQISVNGKIAGTGQSGSYLAIQRVWADNDVIEFNLPASIRATRYEGIDQLPGRARYAFEYGPILLAAIGSSSVTLQQEKGLAMEHLASSLTPIDGVPLHFGWRGNPDQLFIPYWQVQDEEFTCYPAIALA